MANTAFQNSLIKVYGIISSFFIFYTCLILFSPLILLFLLYRICISVIFWLFFKGQYKLTGCSEGIYAIDTFANILTITIVCYVEGTVDLTNLQHRFSNTFLNYRDKKTGSKPYEKLLCAIVSKWGFLCFKNTRKSFDITHHVKVCPGIDPQKVYKESEVFEEIGKLADDLWPNGRPRWEVLVFPKIQKDGTAQDATCTAIVLKFHHAYVDGVSLAQICRNVFMDQPPPKLCFDPVNPPIPKIPWYLRVWWWIMVVFMGPYASMRLMSYKEDHVFYEGPLEGGQFFGRSRGIFSLEMFKRIREAFGCCTSAIQHSAYLGAMHQMALKKGFKVPTQIIGGSSFAHLPYKNEYPTNHIYFGIDNAPVGIANPLRRLAAVDQFYKGLATTMYDKMASGLIIRITGIFPAKIVEKTLGKLKCSYFMSNVPGMTGTVRLQGHHISDFFGYPPILNGIRYITGVTMYDKQFAFGFAFARSNLIQNRQDIEDFIGYFENEIAYLHSVTELNYR